MSVSPSYFGIAGFSFPFVVSPSVGDVRTGTQYGAGGTEYTGTLDVSGGGGTVPSASDVRLGVAVGAGAGTLVVPDEADVRDGTGYGAGGTEFTGTLTGDGADADAVATAVWAYAIESGVNARQMLALAGAACGGVLDGAAGTSVTIAAAGNPGTNRVTATVDASGNRSSVTLNLP